MRTITTPAHIGAILATRRKHLKLSQAAVAEKVGLSQNRLSVLESNPAALDTSKLLAWLNALDLEMTLGERVAGGKPKAEW
jgi:HTH-type transcriptional regulator / antitoxin HipB